ncbi:glycosyltransferase [Brachybacterium sp. MASK1Z-5]|uniref:D-inositol 3-phosphate glycosyltransferase n=1 Tax=Brachybacterium halotolerans TaxID=2795215 RepID=A0ABS1B7V8_9MICO|nr:glycosyltransferase [Brachybacterium halotolerans]MBK0330729.1 glycosyltransferase [Brachybacterium halotolerans]
MISRKYVLALSVGIVFVASTVLSAVIAGSIAGPVGSVLVAVVLGIVAGVAAGLLLRVLLREQATALNNIRRRFEAQLEEAVDSAPKKSGAQEGGVGPFVSLERLETLLGNGPSGLRDATASIIDSHVAIVRLAARNDIPLKQVMRRHRATELLQRLLKDKRFLEAKPIIEEWDGILDESKLTEVREAYKFFRVHGYYRLASRLMDYIADRFGNERDIKVARELREELYVYEDVRALMPVLPSSDLRDPQGPVLHFVGKALPDTQTGYTLRTRYTVDALGRAGVPCEIVAQAGGGREQFDSVVRVEDDQVPVTFLAGPRRTAVGWRGWLEQNVVGLMDRVSESRPSVIHAHADFINAAIALHVGRAAGIPVVYEARGFWEESWLSRTAQMAGWDDPFAIFEVFGEPEAYALRRGAEARVREEADHIFTLARVMRQHIVDESAPGTYGEGAISIVPNAVDSGAFPRQEADPDLRRELGIEPDDAVVGYISSIVEYEGIGTLIRAFSRLQRHPEEHGLKVSTGLKLLVVGDGPHLDHLRRLVESLGIDGVIMPGRIPHRRILDFYGQIDVFVVPRKPARVCELVTPLKPFEAFSTGRAVVLSDVAALKEIADDARGAAATFTAGDDHDLASVIGGIVTTDGEQERMSAAGADWVRAARSWDANVPAYVEVYSRLGRVSETAG